MFCPNCGTQIPEDSKFCPECGQKFVLSSAMNPQERPAQPTVPTQPNVSVQPTVPTQPNVSVQPIVPTQPNVSVPPMALIDDPPKPKKGHAGIIIVLIVLLLLGAGVGVYFITRNGDDEKPVSRKKQATPTATAAPSLSPTPTTDPALTTEALALSQLIDTIDATESKLRDMESQMQEITKAGSSNGILSFQQWSDVTKSTRTAVNDLKSSANSITGLSPILQSKRDLYYEQATSYVNGYCDLYQFIYDFLVFAEEYLDAQPLLKNYASVTDYYNALYSWSKTTREEFAKIKCPTSVASETALFNNSFALIDRVVQKEYQAVNNNDWLKHFSSGKLIDRFVKINDVWYQDLLSRLKDLKEFHQFNRDWANQIAGLFHEYAALPDNEKADFAFDKDDVTNKIQLKFDSLDTIYPSLYNTYNAFAIMRTGCLSGTRKIVIEAEIPGLSQKYRESFTLTNSFQTIYIKPAALQSDINLKTAFNSQITLSVYEQDGTTLITAKSFPVQVKSQNDFEWISDEYGVVTKDNILCFLTPESDSITRLKRQAIEEIAKVSPLESFVGYQEAVSNWNHYGLTYLQVAGLMRAMYESGVRYNMDTFSVSGSNQHISFPSEVLNNQSGLCIETSLTIASALQSAGMHCFLIFPPGHAQVAVEVWNKGQGQGEYFLIETTALSSASNNWEVMANYANLLLANKFDELPQSGPIVYLTGAQWQSLLSNNIEYLIDCDDALLLGMTPFRE